LICAGGYRVDKSLSASSARTSDARSFSLIASWNHRLVDKAAKAQLILALLLDL